MDCERCSEQEKVSKGLISRGAGGLPLTIEEGPETAAIGKSTQTHTVYTDEAAAGAPRPRLQLYIAVQYAGLRR